MYADLCTFKLTMKLLFYSIFQYAQVVVLHVCSFLQNDTCMPEIMKPVGYYYAQELLATNIAINDLKLPIDLQIQTSPFTLKFEFLKDTKEGLFS